jgi:hypothetical protein
MEKKKVKAPLPVADSNESGPEEMKPRSQNPRRLSNRSVRERQKLLKISMSVMNLDC